MTDPTPSTDEEWRTIPSFPAYEASSHGRIRRAIVGRNTFVGRIKSPQIRPDGYATVTIDAMPQYVHRLVCEAFHGPAPSGFNAAHANGRRSDNVSANLRWLSSADNENDKIAHGTKLMGSSVANAKLTEDTVLAIRCGYRLKLGTQKDFAGLFGVAQTKICDIVNYKTWRHVE